MLPPDRSEDSPVQGRSIRIALLVVAALGIMIGLFAIVATPALMFPRSDLLVRVDAVVVLGPAEPDRLAIADALLEEGRTSQVLVSLSTAQAAARPAYCARDGYWCFTPHPFTTRGEAAFVSGAAKEASWTAVGVITGTAHATRARWIFDRCVPTEIGLIATPAPESEDWAYEYLYQSVGFVKALMLGCATDWGE